jgi:hypothetical protein
VSSSKQISEHMDVGVGEAAALVAGGGRGLELESEVGTGKL